MTNPDRVQEVGMIPEAFGEDGIMGIELASWDSDNSHRAIFHAIDPDAPDPDGRGVSLWLDVPTIFKWRALLDTAARKLTALQKGEAPKPNPEAKSSIDPDDVRVLAAMDQSRAKVWELIDQARAAVEKLRTTGTMDEDARSGMGRQLIEMPHAELAALTVAALRDLDLLSMRTGQRVDF